MCRSFLRILKQDSCVSGEVGLQNSCPLVHFFLIHICYIPEGLILGHAINILPCFLRPWRQMSLCSHPHPTFPLSSLPHSPTRDTLFLHQKC